MIVFTTLADYFIDGKLRVERLNFKIIYYLIGGFIVGLAGWWSNERNYQKSLRANLDNKSKAE